ncbi:MAG: energy-coupling factor transporter ATPase [Oscillospiraceae bacterium]|nr:energy-coupling factor transporter ATPase [Oscillospiraceae bacterium]
MAVITAENLTHTYSAGTPFEKTAIENISLSIPSGQFIGIIGHTGSGKSTFIQHLNALIKPTSGKVLFDGSDINADKVSRREIRRHVGLVFQYPEYQLFEETVYADIAFGPKNMNFSEDEIRERVTEAASFTGIAPELMERSPLELSGGQKRRIAIAGVIAMRPEILILDEPTAGLDPAGCRTILGNICDYKEKTGATVIIISHNMDDVARLAQRIIVFDGGSVVLDGTPDQVFSQAEKLISIGLDIPASTALALELKRQGVELGCPVYTHEGLVEAVLAYREGKTC